MTIGERIRTIRKDSGKSMADFAKELDVTSSSVQCWEYGRNNPSPAMIDKICRTFNVNPEYVFGESEIMHIEPDTDEELIDAALADGDPIIKALLVAIVKKPDGWKALAESILTAADLIKKYTDAGDNKEE